MSEKILIIDREPDVLRALETILKKEGYQVRCASGSEDAISVLKSEPFDLVIMDIRMPGMDGLEFMRQVKKLRDDIEVIVLTGSASIENAVRALRDDGAFDFLTKPLENIDQLITSVKQALQKHEFNKEKKMFAKKLEQANLTQESRVQELTNEVNKVNGELKASLTPDGQYRVFKRDLDSVTRKKILIVDDDPQIHELFTEVLSAHKYETESASDGFEAGVKTLEFKPGLIILDLFMPGMDGFEVCKKMKENSRTSQIKILAITGYDTQENRDRIMEAGADGYIAKPVAMETLLKHVKYLLTSGKNGENTFSR